MPKPTLFLTLVTGLALCMAVYAWSVDFGEITGSWYAELPIPVSSDAHNVKRMGAELRFCEQTGSQEVLVRYVCESSEGNLILPFPASRISIQAGQVTFIQQGQEQRLTIRDGILVRGDGTVFRRSLPDIEHLLRNARELSTKEMTSAQDAARLSICENSLKQLGQVCYLFSRANSNGMYPALSNQAGNLMFSSREVYGEYLSDAAILTCPISSRSPDSTAKGVNSNSYFYLGFACANETEFQAYLEACRVRRSTGMSLADDLRVSPGKGANGGDKIFRLSERVPEHYGISDPVESARLKSEIPIIIEKPENHSQVDGSIHVVFLLGHVKRIKYPGPFPATEKVIEGLRELEEVGSPQPE